MDTSAKRREYFVDAGDGNVGIGDDGAGDKLHISGGNLLFDNNYGVQTKDTGGTARSVLLLDNGNNLNVGRATGANLQLWSGTTTTDIIFITPTLLN